MANVGASIYIATHQLGIKRSMAIRSAIIFNVVEESVGDFGDGLVGNVLVGSIRDISKRQ